MLALTLLSCFNSHAFTDIPASEADMQAHEYSGSDQSSLSADSASIPPTPRFPPNLRHSAHDFAAASPSHASSFSSSEPRSATSTEYSATTRSSSSMSSPRLLARPATETELRALAVAAAGIISAQDAAEIDGYYRALAGALKKPGRKASSSGQQAAHGTSASSGVRSAAGGCACRAPPTQIRGGAFLCGWPACRAPLHAQTVKAHLLRAHLDDLARARVCPWAGCDARFRPEADVLGHILYGHVCMDGDTAVDGSGCAACGRGLPAAVRAEGVQELQVAGLAC